VLRVQGLGGRVWGAGLEFWGAGFHLKANRFVSMFVLRSHPGFSGGVFFFFLTLVTGPRRSLSLKLSDTKV